MSSAKEKAKELVDKFSVVGLQQRNEGKACALITVDEILKSHYKAFSGVKKSTYDYYQEVKKEIELL